MTTKLSHSDVSLSVLPLRWSVGRRRRHDVEEEGDTRGLRLGPGVLCPPRSSRVRLFLSGRFPYPHVGPGGLRVGIEGFDDLTFPRNPHWKSESRPSVDPRFDSPLL